MMENSEIDLQPLTPEETTRLERATRVAIKNAKKAGELNLILIPNTKNIMGLRIIKNNRGDSTHFITTLPRKFVTVEEAKEESSPELMVPEDNLSLDILKRRLTTFLHDHYQEVSNLPTNIYASKIEFKKGNRLARIEKLD